MIFTTGFIVYLIAYLGAYLDRKRGAFETLTALGMVAGWVMMVGSLLVFLHRHLP